jgi:hypothetical protein
MFRLFGGRRFTTRAIAVGIGTICAISSVPAIACEGAGTEDRLTGLKSEGDEIKVTVTPAPTTCTGNVKLENTSEVAAAIKVKREAGIECTLTKGCEGVILNKGNFCESELKNPLITPLYEREYEYKGVAYGPYKT